MSRVSEARNERRVNKRERKQVMSEKEEKERNSKVTLERAEDDVEARPLCVPSYPLSHFSAFIAQSSEFDGQKIRYSDPLSEGKKEKRRAR